MHHGDWVMTSLGVHHLRWDATNLKLSTQYVHLVYLMCKQHESNGAALMVMDALNVTTMKYYGGKLEPGACMSCLLYTSPSPRDLSTSRMPSSA